MRLIELHSRKYPGLFAMVDDSDYELVSQYRWNPSRKKGENTFYANAKTNILSETGRKVQVTMHKLLTGYAMTDHRDHNGLNNQRDNLREVTNQQNLGNQRKTTRETTSRFKGVYKSAGKWDAQIRVNWKIKYLGRFDTETDAAIAYNNAALEAFGEFACFNDVRKLDFTATGEVQE